MTRQTKLLLVLGVVAALYLFSRTSKGSLMLASGVDKLAQFLHGAEGERLTAYKDTAGKWTIGKGHLILPTDGLYPYTDKKTITQAESDAFFAKDSATARAAVRNALKKPATENQRVAMESLAFNIGGPAFMGSTLVKLFNAGNTAAAAEQFLAWNKITKNGAKVVDPGLSNRRAKERALFLTA